MLNPHDVLQQFWKYASFRPGQLDIIHSVLDGKDTLAILPTGGGKSICFQVPVLCLEQIGLVVSPLIALMQDQVEQLLNKGISAAALHSGLSKKEQFTILDQAARSELQFLYVSPERLSSKEFLERAMHIPFSVIAIDEAHCISQWGHDFRPAYCQIKQFIDSLPYPIKKIALTASATPEVKQDIIDQLGFQNPEQFEGSIHRENLQYAVIQTEQKWNELQHILGQQNGSCLIYASTRRTTIQIANRLCDLGYQADFYHGGLSPEIRQQKQSSWIHNHTKIMVCTNAFGMGVDKPNCRLVIHAEIPDCIENYYQEAGRAGRDGELAFPILLYSSADLTKFKQQSLSIPALSDLQTSFLKLCQFCQIAPLSAFGYSTSLQIVEFAKMRQLSPMICHQHLEWLRTLGAIEYQPSAFQAAKLWIKVSHERLYSSFMKREPFEIDIINKILRMYGGVTQLPTKIHTQKIAQQLNFKETTVVSTLQSFHQSGIVEFQSAQSTSEIKFLINYSNIQLDLNISKYEFLSERAKMRKESVLNYLTSNSCRTQYIGSYFGEELSECGNCDICQSTSTKEELSEQDLLTFLQIERTLSELTLNFSISEDEILRRLQQLESRKKIKINSSSTIFTYKSI